MALSNRSRRQKTLIATAIAALIAGAIVAVVAATGSDHGTPKGSSALAGRNGQTRLPPLGGDLKLAVTYLGIDPAKLVEALRSGRTLAQVADATPGRSATGLIDRIVASRQAALAAAVRSGGLTAAQQKAALATLRGRVRVRVDRVGGYPSVVGRRPVRAPAAAAAYLSIGQAQLRTELRSGRTLAQLANGTPGRSARGMIEAIVAATKVRLAAAVAAGRLTQASERQMLANLQQRVAAEVQGSKP